jgi:hypothetical protein
VRASLWWRALRARPGGTQCRAMGEPGPAAAISHYRGPFGATVLFPVRKMQAESVPFPFAVLVAFCHCDEADGLGPRHVRPASGGRPAAIAPAVYLSIPAAAHSAAPKIGSLGPLTVS